MRDILMYIYIYIYIFTAEMSPKVYRVIEVEPKDNTQSQGHISIDIERSNTM